MRRVVRHSESLPGALHTVASQHISTLHNTSGTHILRYVPAQVKHPTFRDMFSCIVRNADFCRRARLRFALHRVARTMCHCTHVAFCRVVRTERRFFVVTRRSHHDDMDRVATRFARTRRARHDRVRIRRSAATTRTASTSESRDRTWSWAGPQRSTLVLGPSRSGKTSSLVIPNLFVAQGPVVSTSTKPDVMMATAPERSRNGWSFLFDPSGEIECPASVERVGWSPLTTASSWDAAVQTSDAMVNASRLSGSCQRASREGTSIGRNEPVHCCHLCSMRRHSNHSPCRSVLRWIDRHDGATALRNSLADGR